MRRSSYAPRRAGDSEYLLVPRKTTLAVGVIPRLRSLPSGSVAVLKRKRPRPTLNRLRQTFLDQPAPLLAALGSDSTGVGAHGRAAGDRGS